ncbi:dTDP-4-amino-4,6-dideoxygalactose transaminase [Thermodesulfovibrio aggregans]|uniref:dTDP-4-amino-4,6-dideoxygalactose transaminase n=1 Tax=Thermodesulfovibrio aggregans TaxID=86166 RepID=A0A0U9HUK8_9BACT|nr:DegT/DnrJ/EryC1/StrS family aminotransferase [Thermodesulfovibrio aggregans]GAQ94529.1 dTDP-4-amino-4,6-dideoxygalactose transaminase [Thermodesulfovibrio aggregans]
MKFYVLDVNIILDNFDTLRRNKYPASVEVYNYLKTRGLGCISSASLDNIKFLKIRDLILEKGYTKTDAEMIVRHMLKDLATNFKIIKTPSYVNIEDGDIEDAQIIATAKAIGGKVITRDEGILRKYGDFSISPDKFLKEVDKKPSIPMLDLTLQTFSIYEQIESSIDKVIQKSNFILGEEVTLLEKKIAEYIGTKYAIGVSSGTDALVLSLRALAIQGKNQEYWDRDDFVITTPFTFTATGDAILRSGATPLFVDIELESYTINPELIKKVLDKYGSKVKGIVPVHLYGHPCNMDEIMDIAREYNLFVVEDCAQSFSTKWDGKMTGSFGDVGCFSFFPSKNLGGFGDGGMITTNNEEVAEVIRMLLKHGGKDKYNVDHIGYNARLDTIQAAVLLAKMQYIDEFTERRRKIASIYNEELKDLNWLKTPYEHPKAYHVYHQYTIRLTGKDRNQLQRYLKENGIDSMVYYPVPLHKMKVFINNGMEIFESLENSELASKSVLSLPIEPLMEEREVDIIVETIKQIKED